MPLKQLLDLTGRTALVTGGSRGLGLQIAEALQDESDEHGRRRHGRSEGSPLGDGAAAARSEGLLSGDGAAAATGQASCATVARSHSRRRSAKGGPARGRF